MPSQAMMRGLEPKRKVKEGLIFELWLKSEHGTELLYHKAPCLEKEEIKIKERKDIFCELDLNNLKFKNLRKSKKKKSYRQQTLL